MLTYYGNIVLSTRKADSEGAPNSREEAMPDSDPGHGKLPFGRETKLIKTNHAIEQADLRCV